MTTRAFSVAAVLLIAACSSSPGGGVSAEFSCTAAWPMADGGTGPPAVCVEATGATNDEAEQNRQKCESEKSTFAFAACERSNLAGGCRMQRGEVVITTWYYLDRQTTTEDARKTCEGLASVAQGGVAITFVPP